MEFFKEVIAFWNKTYAEELENLNSKFSSEVVESRIFNDFNEQKAIESAKEYVKNHIVESSVSSHNNP